MSPEELRKLFPKASEAFIRANSQITFECPKAKRRSIADMVMNQFEKLQKAGKLPPVAPQDIPHIGLPNPPFHSQPYMLGFARIPIISEANTREHFRPKAARVAKQRETVRAQLWELQGLRKPTRITLCRLGKRPLDGDNLANSFKHVRDEISVLLNFNDRDPSVIWVYEQTSLSAFKRFEGFEWVVEWEPVRLCPHCHQALPRQRSSEDERPRGSSPV